MAVRLENKRLMTCAELLREKDGSGRCAADIGTDHGYLAAYLVDSGICERVIAADINEQPLEAARKTVQENGLQNKITLVLSDGLDSVPMDGITDVICAGMGGELIIDILSRQEWIKQGVTLLLQPMTKADVLRKWLYDSGFYVDSEHACRDGKFVYAIMRAEYAPERIDYECSARYLAAGRITADGADGSDYLSERGGRLIKAGSGMLMSADKKQEGEELIKLGESLIEESRGAK